MPDNRGRIITFYSYKGGTGRTMALANVAWILASNGKRVLAMDWDLEAPGLHRYFRPFLLDQDLTSSGGLIDLVWEFAAATVKPLGSAAEARTGWHEAFADIFGYVTALRYGFRPPGKLDFLPPGLQGPAYAARVNSFNWQNFYDRLGGGAFLESLKARMRMEYDYILIDSRTGVSDTSGICTVQMPDDLVVCFTANYQSLEGVLAVASSVRKQWSESRERVARGRIFPVLMRAEAGEMSKLILARRDAQARFSSFLDHLTSSDRNEYWGAVETSYIPWYAFEEVLAPFVDEPKIINSLLGAAERLTQYLTDRDVMRVSPPSKEERIRILAQYLRTGEDMGLEQSLLPASLSPSSVLVSTREGGEHEPLPVAPRESLEPGHKEGRHNLPNPLDPSTFWNPAGWSLPETSVSFASAAMLPIVCVALQRELITHPRLIVPWPLDLSMAATSAAIAWFIAFRCRRRPGALLPRIWVLSLALLTTATVLVIPFVNDSWIQALAAAGMASSATLSARLCKLQPDSEMLPYIAPIVFVSILALGLIGFLIFRR
jgi:hypothetical protein